jgi:hypothetical protein
MIFWILDKTQLAAGIINSIRWWCCNIATGEGGVDNWKSEVIAIVVEFCF